MRSKKGLSMAMVQRLRVRFRVPADSEEVAPTFAKRAAPR